MAKYKDISVFEGLSSLRFFAAFLVVMHHSEVIKKKNGLYNFEWLSLFRNGGNAVIFFFVLSGFLITYLLLKENHRTGAVSSSNFYIKRILRICPLYYLLVIIGLIILPVAFHILEIPYEMPYALNRVWYYFVFFLPGLVTYFYGHHFLEFLWSIGVEEVFYLIWPLLFKFFKRYLPTVLIAIILIKVILMAIVYFFSANDGLSTYLVYMFNFESIAIGGLGAYFIFYRDRPLSNLFIYKKIPQLIIYSILAVFLIASSNIQNTLWKVVFETPILSPIFIDLLYLYLIIGISVIDNSIIKLRSKALSYLGNISYGIYMYHMLVVFSIVHLFKKDLLLMSPIQSQLVYYSILTISIILVSAASKTFFESYFLKLKPKLWNSKTRKHSEPAKNKRVFMGESHTG